MHWKFALIVAAAMQPACIAGFNYVRTDQAVCTVFGCHSRVSYYGSAVAVAHWKGGSVFISAGHNFESESSEHKTTQILIGGSPAQLRRVWYGKEFPSLDFAVLYMPGRHAILMPIAASPPKEGDAVTVSGFDFTDSLNPKALHFHGEVSRIASRDFGSLNFGYPIGVSGGPVTKDGELVGIAVHVIKEPRFKGDIGGFQVNYDFRKSIVSLFPGAIFATPKSKPIQKNNNSTGPATLRLKAPPPPKDDEKIQDRDDHKNKGKGSIGNAVTDGSDQIINKPANDSKNSKSSTDDEPTSGGNSDKAVAVPGLIEKAQNKAFQIEDKLEGVSSIIDTVVGSPWVSAGLTAAGIATGGATVYAPKVWNMYRFWRRRRRRRKGQPLPGDDDDTKAADEIVPEKSSVPITKFVADDASSVQLDELRSQVAALTRKSEVVEDLNEIVQQVAADTRGLVAGRAIGADGNPEEELSYWKDGVRLAASGQLGINVLGAKQVAAAIEKEVQKRAAESSGVKL
jgi:hypothetical protein